MAKACVERVCSPEGGPVAEPMRYLRRAVELIADTGHLVQVRCHVHVYASRCVCLLSAAVELIATARHHAQVLVAWCVVVC